MSVRSAPYYWLVCDEPNCTNRWPDYEVNAYEQADVLDEGAKDSDWTVTGDGRHFCREHFPLDAEEAQSGYFHDERDVWTPGAARGMQDGGTFIDRPWEAQ